MDFDTESPLSDTSGFDFGDMYHETLHAELPPQVPYTTVQQTLASGDANSSAGLGGLDQLFARTFATGESLVGLWGKAQNLELQREAMQVRTAIAKGDLEIAKAQNDARKAVELTKAQATAAAAQAGASTIKTALNISPATVVGLAVLAFVGARLLRGKK